MSSTESSGLESSPLRASTLRQAVESRPLGVGLGIVAFVIATAIGARIAVPLPVGPVPMTLQPLFVILAGAVLGPWTGAVAMVAYVATGAAGAPVFSGGGAGVAWLMGPTGGYLLAYPAAAFVVGLVAGTRRGRLHGVRLLAGLALGVATMYVGGLSQLWILTRQDPGALLAQGVLPFLVGDALKILIAAVLVLGFARPAATGRDEAEGGPGGP